MNFKKICITSYILILTSCVIMFTRDYKLYDLLKLYRVTMKYRNVIAAQKIITGIDVDTSFGLIPVENIDGSVKMKMEFLDSLDIFLNIENIENMDFGVEWSILKENTNLKNKEFMRKMVEGEIEIVNLYFDYLETMRKLKKMREELESSEQTWKTNTPIEYGLLRIESQNIEEKLKTMCGLPEREKLNIIAPKQSIHDITIDIGKVMEAIYILYSPSEVNVDLNLKTFVSKENTDMQFNIGFQLSWKEVTDFDTSNWRYFAELEMDKVRKLYSQMEFLKKILKDYEKDSKDIFEHYSLEVLRLYYQLKVVEEILK